MTDDQQRQDQYGVLLYYKYTTIPDVNSLFTFYECNCSSLGLLGRVRLAAHGVNVTIGGKLSSLESHIDAAKSISLFEGTDFKLASSDYPSNDKVAHECGFTSLSIRIVKELVTFSSHPLLNPPHVSNAGKHLSAFEFHSILQGDGQVLDEESSSDNKNIVLLDARNLYETRIGKFQTPSVETLDPGIRQYSDLPTWIDNNTERLQGKRVLMYCTGGIRCEMASAYVRSKGAGFENVFQLYGGIQRYLEQFPDGGFFKGKNFVFDHRISVGSSDADVMGSCLLCGTAFDDYSSRCRCTHCRMLVLVCDSCRNASNFKGRTASLAKKLKNIAELVFVDAPHGLPFIYQHSDVSSPLQDGPPPPSDNCKKRFAWFVAPDFNGWSETDWKIADGPFDPHQYKEQTGGFDVSLAYLKTVFAQDGPFDGILGFSQGAAMAASICAQRERLKGEIDFRFAILCSGFSLHSAEFEHGSINCPSLHIFGSDLANDRQIANKASKDVARTFEEGCSAIIEHDCGHIIPTRSPYINEIKNFLHQFI